MSHVRIELEPGVAQVGLWCGNCMLPSRISVPVMAIDKTGISELGYIHTCENCTQ